MSVKKLFLSALLFANLISAAAQANEIAVGAIVKERLAEIHKMPINEQMKSFTELQVLLNAELSVVQTQVAISAENEKMNQKVKVRDSSDAFKATVAPSSINLNNAASVQGGAFIEDVGLPLVTGIEGGRDQYWATLLWPEGSSQTVTTGDVVKNFTVMEINNVRVRVKTKQGKAVWISKTEPGLNSSMNVGGSISQPNMPY